VNILFHKRFDKMAGKLSPKVKQKLRERLELFRLNPTDPRLRMHALHSPYGGSYSIDITGDYRAIYVLVDDATALFTHIGTRSQLY
jgi:mRNA-degrading endonuclease YafQ of YafQ-DinJ toxin-antitoxin module